MRNIKELGGGRQLWIGDDGVVQASDSGGWLPGLFDSEETATFAFCAPNQVIQWLQVQANKRRGVITLLDFHLGPHLWYPVGHIVPRWVWDLYPAKRHRITFGHDVWVVPLGDRVLVLDPAQRGTTIRIYMPGENVKLRGGRGYAHGCWMYGGPPRQIINNLVKDGLLKSSNAAWRFASLAMARFDGAQKEQSDA